LDVKGRKWREAGEDCIMRSFIICTLHQILLEYEYERGGAYSTHVKDEKSIQIWVENLKGRSTRKI
jgi:hypothetical protein